MAQDNLTWSEYLLHQITYAQMVKSEHITPRDFNLLLHSTFKSRTKLEDTLHKLHQLQIDLELKQQVDSINDHSS